MKATKRILAALLAIAMIAALATTAFADNASMEGHSFTAFQIFAATSIDENKTLGNISWGADIPESVQSALLTAYSAADVQALAEMLNNDNAKAFAQTVYTEIMKYNKDAAEADRVKGTPITSGETTLPLGYYLVMDSTTGDITKEDNFVYNLSILQISDNKTAITVTSKVDVPKVDKEILDEEPTKNNEASIGDKVSYKVTGTLPTNLADYETYFYRFTDTMSKGLTYNKDMKVTIGGVDVTSYFYVGDTTDETTKETTITVAIGNLLAMNSVDGITVNKDTEIVLTYSATLNEDAVIAGEGNPNLVDLVYSNNPDDSGHGVPTTAPSESTTPTNPEPEHPVGETPKDKVVTYTTEITLLKTNDKHQVLPGAEFTLTGDGVNIVLVTSEVFTEDENGTYWKLVDGTYTTTAPTVADDETDNTADYADINTKYTKETVVTPMGGTYETNVVGVVDELGHITFSGLGAGTYTLTETKTPAGYNTCEPIVFTIGFNMGEDGKTPTFTSDNENVKVGEDNTLFTAVVNFPGTILPETGGIGTTLFYVLGGILVVCAGVLLITKRRMAIAR